MTRRSRRTRGRTLQNWGNLLHIGASIAAGYIGAQHREEMERLKAENQVLRNQVETQKIGKIHNDVLLGDLTIEKRILEIEKLKRDLGLKTAPFTAKDYDEPGKIR